MSERASDRAAAAAAAGGYSGARGTRRRTRVGGMWRDNCFHDWFIFCATAGPGLPKPSPLPPPAGSGRAAARGCGGARGVGAGGRGGGGGAEITHPRMLIRFTAASVVLTAGSRSLSPTSPPRHCYRLLRLPVWAGSCSRYCE